MMAKFQERIAIPKWNDNQRRIGLTGGIASGKSTIGNFLKTIKSHPILDADVYSHEALQYQTNSAEQIIKRYGNKITCLNKNNDLIIDRKALGKIIFQDKKEREWIESLLHPIILKKFIKEIEENKHAPILILIIPLLFEANLTSLCNEIWVINCSRKEQLKRLIKRDKISEAEASLRINCQWSLEKKLKLADVVIENSYEVNVWKNQINTLL